MTQSLPLIVPLATLHQLKQHLALDDADARDDERLWNALMSATATLHQRTGRTYQPHYATIAHDANPRQPARLSLIADALTIYRLEDAFGTLQQDDFRLMAGGILRLIGGRSFIWQGDGVGALAVTGVWGWHESWAQAWRDSGDALEVTLHAGDSALIVDDSTAPDALHSAPRFQRGQLLAIGSGENAEYVGVMDVERDTNRLLIVRGIHGTQAQTHTAGALIRIYNPPYHIQHTCLRLASWLYRLTDGGVDDVLPFDLQNDLTQWRRIRV